MNSSNYSKSWRGKDENIFSQANNFNTIAFMVADVFRNVVLGGCCEANRNF